MPAVKKTTKAGKEDRKKKEVGKTAKVAKKKTPAGGEARQRRPVKKKAPAKKPTVRTQRTREIKPIAKPALKKIRYFEAVGRRKTAVARIRLQTQGERVFFVNGKLYQEYFPILELQRIAAASFDKMKCLDKFKILVKVKGGGLRAQAEAVRHGTARALVEFNLDFKKRLKRAGFLTRDPRMKERRKPGLKKARRAPQWKKR